MTISRIVLEDVIKRALDEDLGQAGDITTLSVIDENKTSKVVIAARKQGVIAGVEAAELVFKTVDPSLKITVLKKDGAEVMPKDEIMFIEGSSRSILIAERCALNFMGRMSGIATLTRKMADACGSHKAKIAATRKTTPNFRAIEKWAVELGGGIPHRMGLYDAVMIKDNHIAMAGGVSEALRRAKAHLSHTVKIEIEVDTLEQLQEVLKEGADIVMLDNMSLDDMKRGVEMISGKALVEASGNVTLERVPLIAATGVDIISSGAITHSAPNFDVGLDFVG